MSEEKSRVRQLRQRLAAAQEERTRVEALRKQKEGERSRVAGERAACESRVQSARNAMNETGFEAATLERVERELRVRIRLHSHCRRWSRG